MSDQVSQLESTIRDLINTPRTQELLIQDLRNWNQLCSALDTIGDSQCAIDSYVELDWPSDLGERYLRVYGLLQAMFLQQDATKHLAESLGVDLSQAEHLQSIRDIRNCAVGHPTKRGRKSPTAHFISRATISKWRFDLMNSSEEGDDFQEVDLRQLVSDQSQGVEIWLRSILETLRLREQQHRERFADMSLAELFHRSKGYLFEKIFEGIHNPERRSQATVHLKLIAEMHEKFRAALEERGELPALEHVAYELERTVRAAMRLRTYFESGNTPDFDETDAYIYAWFLRERNRSLQEMAKSIDENYASSQTH